VLPAFPGVSIPSVFDPWPNRYAPEAFALQTQRETTRHARRQAPAFDAAVRQGRNIIEVASTPSRTLVNNGAARTGSP